VRHSRLVQGGHFAFFLLRVSVTAAAVSIDVKPQALMVQLSNAAAMLLCCLQ
jgi:hypothetical protein